MVGPYEMKNVVILLDGEEVSRPHIEHFELPKLEPDAVERLKAGVLDFVESFPLTGTLKFDLDGYRLDAIHAAFGGGPRPRVARPFSPVGRRRPRRRARGRYWQEVLTRPFKPGRVSVCMLGPED